MTEDLDYPPTWILVRPLKADTPASVRMRAALKCLLRSYRLRVVKVSGVGPRGERAETASAKDATL